MPPYFDRGHAIHEARLGVRPRRFASHHAPEFVADAGIDLFGLGGRGFDGLAPA